MPSRFSTGFPIPSKPEGATALPPDSAFVKDAGLRYRNTSTVFWPPSRPVTGKRLRLPWIPRRSIGLSGRNSGAWDLSEWGTRNPFSTAPSGETKNFTPSGARGVTSGLNGKGCLFSPSTGHGPFRNFCRKPGDWFSSPASIHGRGEFGSSFCWSVLSPIRRSFSGLPGR
jgi:hypothetical protein